MFIRITTEEVKNWKHNLLINCNTIFVYESVKIKKEENKLFLNIFTQ